MNLLFSCFLQDLINCNIISVTKVCDTLASMLHLYFIGFPIISQEWPNSFPVYFHSIYLQVVVFSRNVSLALRTPSVSTAYEIFWSELDGNVLTQLFDWDTSLHCSWNILQNNVCFCKHEDLFQNQNLQDRKICSLTFCTVLAFFLHNSVLQKYFCIYAGQNLKTWLLILCCYPLVPILVGCFPHKNS